MFTNKNLIFILGTSVFISLYSMQSSESPLTQQRIKELSKFIIYKNHLLDTLVKIDNLDSPLIKDEALDRDVRLFLKTENFEKSFCKLLRNLDKNDSPQVRNFEEISRNSLWEIIVAHQTVRTLLEQKSVSITYFNSEPSARQLQKSDSSGSSQSTGSSGSYGDYFWGYSDSQESQPNEIFSPESVFFPSSSQSSHMFDDI